MPVFLCVYVNGGLMHKSSFTMDKNVSESLPRLAGIDAVAGIMILNMIVGHCHGFPFQIYLSFFMPWFFFKSGMFYRHQSTKECIKKSAKKLLYPFVTFTIVGCIVHFCITLLQGDYNWIHYTLTPIKELILAGTTCGNQPLWFLVSLFIVKVIYSVADNHIRYPILVVIPSIIVACLLYYLGNPLPDYFCNGSAGLAFYAIGYALSKKQYFIPIAVLSIIVYLSFAIWGITVVDMRGNSLRQGTYVLWFVISTAGCVTFNSIFSYIPYRFKILTWVGKNAMILYVTHWMIIDVYDCVTQLFMLDGTQRIAGLFGVMIITEYFIVRLLGLPKMQFLLTPSLFVKDTKS